MAEIVKDITVGTPVGDSDPLYSIFAGGELGAIYDHSDLSSLFTTYTGETNVATNGDTVGVRKNLLRETDIIEGAYEDSFASGASGFVGGSQFSIAAAQTIGDFSDWATFTVSSTAGDRFCIFPTGWGERNGAKINIKLQLYIHPGNAALNGIAIESGGGTTWSVVPAASTQFKNLTAGVVYEYDVVVHMSGYVASDTIRVYAYEGLTRRGTAGDKYSLRAVSIDILDATSSVQASSDSRPTWASGLLTFDGVNDALVTTFPNLGTDCTIARAIPGTGASILTGQTINGAWTDNVSSNYVIIVDRALTAAETARVTEFLEARATIAINLMLVAGQSNTDGRVPKASGPAWITDGVVDGVLAWNGTSFIAYNVGSSSIGISSSGRGNFSFAQIALYAIAAEVENLAVCQSTVGGTFISLESGSAGCWNADYDNIPVGTPKRLLTLKTKFEAIQAYCTANGITLNVIGMLWHQGEGDKNRDYANYQTNMEAIIAEVRSFTGVADLPFMMGTVPATSSGYRGAIRTAQLAIAAADAAVYCRDNDDLTFFDGLHFDATSCETFGDEVAVDFLAHIA